MLIFNELLQLVEESLHIYDVIILEDKITLRMIKLEDAVERMNTWI